MDERRFRNWLSNLYYKETNDLLSEEDIKKIVRILEAEAESGNVPRHRLDVRVRGYNNNKEREGEEDQFEKNGSSSDYDEGGEEEEEEEDAENFSEIYYDLTNPRWEAIKITSEGWEIVKDPPILFRRYGNELPQCYPDRNYPSDILDQFIALLNVKKDEHKQLLKTDIVSLFWTSTIPKPVLITPAVQGSAKLQCLN
jgi:hypothetical protein